MLNRSFIRRPFRYVFWNAALVIVGVNILVFLYLRIFPDEVRFLAMNPAFVVERGMLWQVFTYQFVHGNFSHLFFNMLGLVFFGIAVERRIGSRESFYYTFFLVPSAGPSPSSSTSLPAHGTFF
jgi:membrane associated rhomboid family serine protease